jgi:hypothetical protein
MTRDPLISADHFRHDALMRRLHIACLMILCSESAQKLIQKKVRAACWIKASYAVTDGKEWEVCVGPMQPIPRV